VAVLAADVPVDGAVQLGHARILVPGALVQPVHVLREDVKVLRHV
jgi:hypothetical protein